MQDPTEDDAAPILPTETVLSMEVEAPIPTEIVSDDPNMNRKVTDSRKAAKRTLPWDLNAGELLVSQDEDNPARKKPRLEEPLPTTTTAKLLERLIHLILRESFLLLQRNMMMKM
jgi:hypothetical protein